MPSFRKQHLLVYTPILKKCTFLLCCRKNMKCALYFDFTAKVSSSSEAEVKKDKPVWGPWGELICYNCQYWTPEQPGARPWHWTFYLASPIIFPCQFRSPMVPNASHHQCPCHCQSPQLKKMLLLQSRPVARLWTNLSGACATQAQLAMLASTKTLWCKGVGRSQRCKMVPVVELRFKNFLHLFQLKPCVEKYANKKAIKKMWVGKDTKKTCVKKRFASFVHIKTWFARNVMLPPWWRSLLQSPRKHRLQDTMSWTVDTEKLHFSVKL